MKATFNTLSDKFFKGWTLRRSINNTFIQSDIDAEMIFTGDDYRYLLEERLKGNKEETGLLTHECEAQTFEKDIYIKHNEGSFDLKECQIEKKVVFQNPLDCIIEQEVNIFDFPVSNTSTFQGTLNRLPYVRNDFLFLGEADNPYTLEQILSFLGGIPDKTSEGYTIEYIRCEAVPIIEPVQGNGDFEQYVHHYCVLFISYIRSYGTTQYNSNWIEDPLNPGNYWLNPTLYQSFDWNAPLLSERIIPAASSTVGRDEIFTQSYWTLGREYIFKNVSISNTVLLNPILEQLFSCSGLQLVSNFFGINSDATNPNNRYYEFASLNCQDIKIVQSFDIIRESALEDSFGKSGLLKGKDILTDISLFFNMIIVPDFDNELIRWEHISYFQDRGIDLTNKNNIDFQPLESSKEEIDSELFLMAQPTTETFYRTQIRYQTPDLYREENEKKYQVKKFLTDVFETLNNPKYEGEEYKPLFYLLSTDGDNIISLNYQFSMSSIFRELHDLNRPYKIGQIGSVALEFGGYSIGLEGEIIIKSSVITWDSLIPLMSVKTKYGTFQIKETEFEENGLLTLKTRV